MKQYPSIYSQRSHVLLDPPDSEPTSALPNMRTSTYQFFACFACALLKSSDREPTLPRCSAGAADEAGRPVPHQLQHQVRDGDGGMCGNGERLQKTGEKERVGTRPLARREMGLWECAGV
jgi:hypothetical protein